jgi:polyphenol oxidase
VAAHAPFHELAGQFVIDLPGARAAFSTRRGGHSPAPYDSLNVGFATDDDPALMARNRQTLSALVGAPPSAWMYQVHGTEVDVLRDAGEQGLRPRVDGRVTRTPGVALGALSADCLPIAIAGGGAAGIVHAGWRGLAAGVIEAEVAALRELAGRGAELAAAIGPGAGPCCYQVGPEVHAAFAGDPQARVGDRLDLKAVAAARLRAAGVAEVHDLGLCTICTPRLFFSHRRDRGVTGRQAGLVWLS